MKHLLKVLKSFKFQDDSLLGNMSSVGAGVAGGILGAGITYFITKPKIERLEAENIAQAQTINAIEIEKQMLRSANYEKDRIIAQLETEKRQDHEEMAKLRTEINKLKEERKRALNN